MLLTDDNNRPSCSLANSVTAFIYFASAAVTVESSHITTSSAALWSKFNPPSNVVNGHLSTMWFTVCCWPQSQEGDWPRPHLCTVARHGLDLFGNGSSDTMYDEGQSSEAAILL